MSELHVSSRPPRSVGPANGETALLVHGTMDRSTSFTRISQRLPDWTVLTYDRRGYAGSSGRLPSSSFADQVDDLFEVLDTAGPPPPGQVVAFGHSLGGAVVLTALARQPERFAAAVVYEAPASWESWWLGSSGEQSLSQRDPADMAEGFMRQVVGDEIWERLPEKTRLQRRHEGQTMLAEIRALGVQRPFDPERISVPVIVARGQRADPRHVRSADSLVASIRSARLVVVDEAAHGAHISHPERMAELISQSLELAREATR